MDMETNDGPLVDRENGLVSRRIFFDPEIYAQELRDVFAKTWLFIGHESQIPGPGDFFTNYMGEDPVIAWRDQHGKIRIYLNSCRHRGMRLCRTDFGTAKQFTCPFHGWTYSNDGALIGVPFLEEAYFGDLERDDWGLYEVPKVTNYGGFIFANMDAGCIGLDDYLGDFRWYFDLVLARPIGKIEVLPGRQRYSCKSNWKIAGENFAGDSYHLPYSHGSLFRVDGRRANPVSFQNAPNLYGVTTQHGHGLCGIAAAGERLATDRELARELGPEIAEYVEQSQRRFEERVSPRQAELYTIAFGNIFPNFSLNHFSALRPIGLYLWHPRGATAFETWQWCAMDSEAPAALKEMIRVDFSRQQSATGIAGQDDTENFEQVTEATRGAVGQRLSFNYQMGLNHEDDFAAPAGLPGTISPYYNERGQRNFYAYWADLMGVPATASDKAGRAGTRAARRRRKGARK